MVSIQVVNVIPQTATFYEASLCLCLTMKVWAIHYVALLAWAIG